MLIRIAKNITALDVIIPDLGDLIIPAFDQVILNELYPLDEVFSSEDLLVAIDADEIIINDGVSDLGKNASKTALNYSMELEYDTHAGDTNNPHNVLATQITDFDTEVDNNPTVVTNTAHRDTVTGNPHNIEALDTPTDTTNFNKYLSGSDDTVQKALDTIDDHLHVHDDVTDFDNGVTTSPTVVSNTAHRNITTGNPHSIDGVDIPLDTTDFGKELSSADNTVQKAFDTLDDHVHEADETGADTTDFNKYLSGSDDTVQKALDTLDDHLHVHDDVTDFDNGVTTSPTVVSNTNHRNTTTGNPHNIEALDTPTDTTNFNKYLSSSDDTVQKALDTLDDHLHIATDVTDFDTEVSNNTTVVSNTNHRNTTTGNPHNIEALDTPTDTTNFNKYLSSADDTVQKALDTLDDHTHVHDDVTDFDNGVDTNTTVVANTNHRNTTSGNPHNVQGAEMTIDTTNFNKYLSSSDDTTQKALDTLDDHLHVHDDVTDFDSGVTTSPTVVSNTSHRNTTSGNPHDVQASEIDTDVTNFNGYLSGSDDTVQKALDTLDDHTHNHDDITDFDNGVTTSPAVVSNTNHRNTATGNPHMVTKTEVGLGNVDNVQQIPLSQKGQPNGVATLDSGGHVPASQLDLDHIIYKGTWNASTNTPTLGDNGAGGDAGHYYVVNVAGTTNIDGISDWEIGDWIINNGAIWEKVDNSEKVTSVAGKTGDVVLDHDDITDFDNGVDTNATVVSNTAHRNTVTGNPHNIEALDTPTDTTNFNKYLSTGDDTVQKALDTLDDHTHVHDDVTDFDNGVTTNTTVVSNTSHRNTVTGNPHNIEALDTPTDTTNFNKSLSSADDTVQKALDTLDDHTHLHDDVTDFDNGVTTSPTVVLNTNHRNTTSGNPHDVQASEVDTNVTGFNGKLSASDDTVQKALDTLDDHVHTASEVTDFDTEVSNNTDVSANTSHRNTTSGNPHDVQGSEIDLDTTDFDGYLSGSDDTIQKAFDTLDDHTHVHDDVTDFDNGVETNSVVTANTNHRNTTSGNPHDVQASEVDTNVTNFNGKLSGSDDTVQKALDTLDDHVHTASEVTDFDTEVSNNTDVSANTSHRNTTSGNPHDVRATEISDFDTEVENNTDVAANTSKRHDRLHDLDSVSDHNGISGTEDNFMAIDANGLPKDSGKNDTDYADAVHTHIHDDVTDFDNGVDTNTTVVANTNHRNTTSGNPHDVQASEIGTDTTNFDGKLSGLEDTVQKALDALDDHTHTEDEITDLDHYTSADFATDFGNSDLANLGFKAHNSLTGVTKDQHHNEDHQGRHNQGGADALKLDDLATPDDNTDLDSSTSRHGLLPKLNGDTADFLRGDGTWATPPQLDWDEQQIYYVGKHGNDTTNDGKRTKDAFLTIAKAVATAEAQTPSTSNRFVIWILDAGVYTENVTINLSYVNLYAPEATIVGNITVKGHVHVIVGNIESSTGVAILKDAGANSAFFNVTYLISTSTASAILNSGPSGSLLNVVALGVEKTDGYVIGDLTTSQQITQVNMHDVDVYGNCTVIARVGGSGTGDINVRAAAIFDRGSGTTVGLNVQGGNVRLICNVLGLDTAYNLSGGSIYLLANSITGTRTQTGGNIYLTESGYLAQKYVNPLNGASDTGKVATYNHSTGNIEWQTPKSLKDFKVYTFFADQMDYPFSTDWAVNSGAPASSDSNNRALIVRKFDDSTQEGVGFILDIPTGATNIIISFRSRAETAPGGASGVVPRLYVREVPDNGAVESWSSGTNLTTISIPTNENFQYDTQTLTISSLGLVAGRVAQFELTRNPGAAADNLSGDWSLLLVKVSFS